MPNVNALVLDLVILKGILDGGFVGVYKDFDIDKRCHAM